MTIWTHAKTTLTSRTLLNLNLGRDMAWTRRRGIIFCGTAIQKKCLRLIFSTILINHLWNGAAPNFIMTTKRRMSLNIRPLHNERIKTTELNAWNIKYFTTYEFLKLCWYRSKIIINLNILISILNQINTNEFEVRPNTMLNKFIKKAKMVSKGEILMINVQAAYISLNLHFSA